MTKVALDETARVDREVGERLNQVTGRVVLNQAAVLWLELEPLLTKDVAPGSLDWFRRKQIIWGGIGVSTQAVTYLERLELTDEWRQKSLPEAKLNLAFFLACLIKLVPAEATEEDLATAIQALPKIDDVTEGLSFFKMSADKLQLLESLSWTELCCISPEKHRWQLARSRAISLLANEKALLSPLVRARYVATFGSAFFEPNYSPEASGQT